MMPLSTYDEHMDASTLVQPPLTRRRPPRPYKAYRPHTMSLRVIEPPNAKTEPPHSIGVKLFDRLHVFTARLGHYGIETMPLLGSGVRLAA